MLKKYFPSNPIHSNDKGQTDVFINGEYSLRSHDTRTELALSSLDLPQVYVHLYQNTDDIYVVQL
jgi:hypothetical protein